MESVLPKLLQSWKDQGLANQPIHPAELCAVEQSLNINLPDEFITFLTTVNGMGGGYLNDTDSLGFSFYPAQDYKVINPDFKYHSLFEKCKFVLFADYLQNSWSFCVALSEKDNEYSIFSFVAGDNYKVVCTSLKEFLQLYLDDSAELYNTNQK